ncbi:MAG: hypothetical protein PHQ12_08040 [Chthoniobacteraceae bacterium]|nr:hypothetical protein [Chthoniobacteraceae bacterium]
MKLNKILLITALSLFAISGLMADQKAKKEEVPGVAAQPASFFYTGKPYDKDLGAYTFNFRNYDPELKRWTTVDPSGFPDGANNRLYVSNNPISIYDDFGLTNKSIAWVFVWADAPNYQDPTHPITAQKQSNAIQAGLTKIFNDMTLADNTAGDTNKYLNDNDSFYLAVKVAQNLNDVVSLLSQFNEIVLFTHGYYNNNTYTMNFNGSSNLTPTQAFGNTSKIYYATCYDGYSPNGVSGSFGEVGTGPLVAGAQTATKNYLRE